MIVYIIEFSNGKQYVGMTCDLGRRLQEHARRPALVGRAMAKHDWCPRVAFSGSRDECAAEEVRLISELGTMVPGGYNLAAGGEGNDGSAETAEAIRRGIAEKDKGRSERASKQWSDPEQAAALRRSNDVRWSSEEARRANGEATKRRWADPEYRERTSAKIREVLKRKRQQNEVAGEAAAS